MLAERLEERHRRTAAERAAGDRDWVFGHVIVDEAQELSPMAWRLLMRRCPTRSMTVVGDVAQTGSAGGVDDWAQALDPYVPGRWRMERLEINYRTPSEIMQIAADVLATAGTGARAPRSARDGRWPPTSERTTGDDQLLDAVAAVEHGRRGVYNIVDDEPATVAEWLPFLAQAVGARRPMHVPRFVGRLLTGEVGDVMMTELRGASNAKAKRELGWTPAHASWREGFIGLARHDAGKSTTNAA